ncbi:MAG TPA: Si-specific NAD(P)(+) transhydrogenase, partial [Candidatus Polarisedimenticolaceae bacterium]|nr:Si-specific NAD(P)(+) transhydrogenase [Candidatus Polarisedimenticolaceae bacterium]
MMAHYDMLVIGSGPAGQKAAIQAAKVGKKVGIVERKQFVGGLCINSGTIPSKSLREAVLFLSGFRQRNLYGASYRVKKDITFEDLLFKCDHVVKAEQEVVQNQLIRNHVDFIVGNASFIGAHRLSIKQDLETNEHSADYIIIAVGTEPSRPAGIPFDDTTIIDSEGLLALKQLPKSLTIVGGGVIGCEYASILATLGIPVVLIERRPRLLEFVDSELIEALQYQMRSIGITLRFNEEVTAVEKHPDGPAVIQLKSGKQIRASLVMYSSGRVGATQGLNLETIGIQTDERGRLAVNENFQTAIPHIYAAGDVIGFPALASTSMQQGRHAACHALGLACDTSTHLLPYGIYTIPEISMVGRNEDELTRDGVPYEIGVARYREIARGQLIGDTVGMLKLLFHSDTRELLGVHIIGEGATELVHIGQAVMALGGKLDYFVDAVFNYPTLAECYKVAAL